MEPIALIAVLIGPLVAPGGEVRPVGQKDSFSKLIGTWVQDSATGPDDKAATGQQVTLARGSGGGIRIIEPGGPPIDCATGPAAMPKAGVEGFRSCTIAARTAAIEYLVYRIEQGKPVLDEEGSLTVSADGSFLIDEFEVHRRGKTTRHRSVYHRSSP
jgi:hypothetical protein